MYILKRIKKELKWWYQRRTRGFDDCSLYSLNTELGKWLLPRFRAYREKKTCVPTRYFTPKDIKFLISSADIKKNVDAEKRMQKDFDAIETFLTLLASEEEDFYTFNKETKKWEYKIEYLKGKKIFYKILEDLWM